MNASSSVLVRVRSSFLLAQDDVGQGAQQQFPRRAAQGVLQGQQPGPAVGALEPSAQRTVEIGELAGDLFGSERLVREPRNLFARIESVERQQGPPAVDAAVPVEAAEKDRVERAWRTQILVAEQDMVELVRKFPGHMAKRDPGEARAEGLVEDHRNAAK